MPDVVTLTLTLADTVELRVALLVNDAVDETVGVTEFVDDTDLVTEGESEGVADTVCVIDGEFEILEDCVTDRVAPAEEDTVTE